METINIEGRTYKLTELYSIRDLLYQITIDVDRDPDECILAFEKALDESLVMYTDYSEHTPSFNEIESMLCYKGIVFDKNGEMIELN